MPKPAPKTNPVRKEISDADRARRKQNIFFVALSVMIVLSMLLSLVRLV